MTKGGSQLILMQKFKGMSLLELLIAITLIGILAAISIPSYQKYLQLQKLAGTTENLYFTLQYARSEAIKRNTNVYVSFQTGTNWCYGVNPNSACTCSTANSCTLGSKSAPNNNQLSLSATGLTNNSVSFEPNHGAAITASTETFTVTGYSASVQIKALGSLRLCSSDLAGYQSCS